MQKIILLLLSILFISGCGYTVPTVKQRQSTLENLIKDKNLTKKIISTKEFNLLSIRKNLSTCKGKILDLYIEGDGLPWVTSNTISPNPTPINPLGLKLFLKDFHQCKLYLARPCQYVKSSMCRVKYWTSGRFSNEVIESFNEALDKIKKVSQVSSFRLFGYSGGGAVATLLADRRDDVSTLVTICGNLDIKEWASEHYLTPLKGSLNPADFAKRLSKINQIHLIGGKDEIVGESVFQSYLKHFKDKSHIKYKIFKEFNHHTYWGKNWRVILKDLDE